VVKVWSVWRSRKIQILSALQTSATLGKSGCSDSVVADAKSSSIFKKAVREKVRATKKGRGWTCSSYNGRNHFWCKEEDDYLLKPNKRAESQQKS